jgi:flagellar biosynthesis protein FlhB
MAPGNDTRTEQPTPRRVQKAREKGQIARSKEVPAAAVLLGMLLVLSYFGSPLMRVFESHMRDSLRMRVPREITMSYLSGILGSISLMLATAVIPLMLAAAVIGIGANVAQGGLAVSWTALGFHVERLNPKNGLSRIFSRNGIFELVKGLALLIVVSVISYQVVAQYVPLYPRLIMMDARQLLYWTALICYQVLIRVGIALAVLAVLDYVFQKHRFLDQLKMTKQEVKEEFKDTEGDPVTRGRIRRVQREMARKRMMAAVPEADVVVTNPTHYAIALCYKMNSMEAPKVVAKGVGFLAQKIKELARKHEIPLVENKPLAQTLYKTVDVGEFIPANLYKAIAEILAYVYKARSMWKDRR